MRVKIEITVAVDPTEWADTYGITNDAVSVRHDVKRWATNALSHHPDGLIELMRPA